MLVRAPARYLLVAILLGIRWGGAATIEIDEPTIFRDEKLGLIIVGGQTRLPASGQWTVALPGEDEALSEVYHQITNWQEIRGESAREYAHRREQQLQADGWKLTSHFEVLKRYADAHAQRTPPSFRDPDLLDLVANGGWPRQPAQIREPTLEAALLQRFEQAVAEIGLVPGVELPKPDLIMADAQPVLLELAPSVDDGLHWVLFANGTHSRVPIDAALLAKLGLTISKKKVLPASAPPKPTEFLASVYARASQPRGAATVVFTDQLTGQTIDAPWQWDEAKPGTRSLLSAWAQNRAWSWHGLATESESSLLVHWMQLSRAVYGADFYFEPPTARGPGTPSVLALFGGRAAVQETLQMQPLQESPARGEVSAPGVPLESVKGVEVKSHPFGEMLAGRTPGRLPLADLVPLDRSFFHASRPEAIAALLRPESTFVARASALSPQQGDYDLRARYSTELGLSVVFMETLLNSGLVQECAIFTPDLFLADGTDVTAIVRVRSGAAWTAVLKPLLSTSTGSDGISEIPAGAGKAYWAMLGDLWLASNHRSELQQALALHAGRGAGSLGQSDEFGYMLAKLPLTERTRAYVYLSDPFIRRQVGPAVKIAQSRRVAARVQLERLVAAALLRQLDVPGEKPDKDRLIALGYLQAADAPADLSLDANFNPSSANFGPLHRMRPLSAQALASVTPQERDAYARFLEGYNRFWRQYFDPIAVRLDAADDNRFELTTFILPLVDSTIYRELRELLRGGGEEAAGQVPVFDRPPVAIFSVTLNEKAWAASTGSLARGLQQHLWLNPEFFDLLGPSLHVAIEDAAPVLRFGSPESAGMAPALMGGGSNMMMYGLVFVNIFTRPTTVAVEVSDPDRMRQLLDAVSVPFQSRARGDRWMQTAAFRRGQGAGEWILNLRLLEVFNLDFSIGVQDRYLVISNRPWSERLQIKGHEPARIAGAQITFHPAALAESLPSDFLTAMQSEQRQAIHGLAWLHPWMQALGCGAADALRINARVLGFAPVLPAGTVDWNDRHLEHSVFGSSGTPRLPDYRGEKQFGLFNGIDDASIRLEFEDDGVRTVLDWRLSPQTPGSTPDR